MAGSGPPNLLSDQMEKLILCISEKTTHSMFNIEVQEMIKPDTSRRAARGRGRGRGRGKKRAEREQKKGPSSSITGFAIAQRCKLITILTCAHGFENAYSDTEAATVKSLENFRFWVICTHEEECHRKLATVKAVDCRKDLLLLELESECPHSHRPLRMGQSPKFQDLVVLQGWPPNCSETVAFGRVTCFARAYNDLTGDNPKGYNMILTELTDLCCANGCSGGPLIDGKLCFVGVYHGTQRKSGYAVSFDDMKVFVDTYLDMEG